MKALWLLAAALWACTPTSATPPDAGGSTGQPAPVLTAAPVNTPLPPEPEGESGTTAKKAPTCTDAYTRRLHLGCPPKDGHGWIAGGCSKLTAAQVAKIVAASTCLAAQCAEGC